MATDRETDNRRAADALDEWRSAERQLAVADTRRQAVERANQSAELAERAATATAKASRAAMNAASAAEKAARATSDAARATSAATQADLATVSEEHYAAETAESQARRRYQQVVERARDG